jgi:outer membrane protein TolC
MPRRASRSWRAPAALHALASLLLLSTSASAQPARAPAAPAQAPATPQAPPIEVNDPLLTPVPAPPHVLASWREALTMIANRSVDVAVAMQEIQRAEGLARQALALALPTITATGSITGQIITGSGTTIVNGVPVALTSTNPSLLASISASQPILAPRAWYGIRTADMGISSSKLSVEDKRRTVLAVVASSIVAVFTAERVADINRNGLRSSLERLDLTRRKFRLGDGTKLDVLRAEQDAASTRSTLISGDESLFQARESLGLALGFHEAYGVPPSISLGDIEQAVAGVCAPGPLDKRADIMAAKNDLEIAKRGITDAWLAFSPYATLSTTASVANYTQGQSDHNGAWQVQALLTIPLWEGGARYGGLRIARANAEESKLKLEATLRGATFDVAQALRSVGVAEQGRQVSEQSRDLAREASRLAQRAYEVGTGTSFDLVDTAKAQRAAELDLAVKEFTVVKARITALLAASTCSY